jgi:hypothetical protein
MTQSEVDVFFDNRLESDLNSRVAVQDVFDRFISEYESNCTKLQFGKMLCKIFPLVRRQNYRDCDSRQYYYIGLRFKTINDPSNKSYRCKSNAGTPPETDGQEQVETDIQTGTGRNGRTMGRNEL